MLIDVMSKNVIKIIPTERKSLIWNSFNLAFMVDFDAENEEKKTSKLLID